MSKNNSNQQSAEKFKSKIGGQALIEGIMMLGPNTGAISNPEVAELMMKLEKTSGGKCLLETAPEYGRNGLPTARRNYRPRNMGGKQRKKCSVVQENSSRPWMHFICDIPCERL